MNEQIDHPQETQVVEQEVGEPAPQLAPVDASLLDGQGTTEDDAYELPDLQEVAAIEQRTAEQVATVRDEQSLRIANMGRDGVNHFLVNVEGRELCGGCGQPFPCEKWNAEIDPRNTEESAGRPVPDEDKVRAIVELLGVPVEQARQMVLMSTPLDEIGGRHE